MKLLVKIGGTLLDEERTRRKLAEEIVRAARNGAAVVVVHGGGKQMTRFLQERGIESRFVGGLRVTTPETLDAVLKVLAGSVNQQLVAALIQAGARAVGLTGVDACLTEAEPMGPELGAVGRPVRANAELLELLTQHGYLPVVACVAGDREGRIYNVNADQMACALAAGFGADRLIFLTDVAGVLGADGRPMTALSICQAEALVAQGTATGGMQAKLQAACAAVRQGVERVLIAPGSEPRVLERLLSGEQIGTQLRAEEP